MNTTIQKWGNSVAVRLPKEVLEKSTLHEGSRVLVQEEKGRIVITQVPKKQKKIHITELVRAINSTNIHKEVSWGKRQGNEVW